MGYPPVVVVESGGVPRTQVAEGVSAPAFTVATSGARAITLADGHPPIALFNPDGTPYTGVRYSEVAQELFARYAVQPEPALGVRVDALLTGLIDAGIAAKLDAFYIFPLHTSQAAYLNILADAYNLTVAGGAPTFTPYQGVIGDGATDRLGTGFNPATAVSPKYTRDLNSMFVYSRSDMPNMASGTAATSFEFGNTTARLGRQAADTGGHSWRPQCATTLTAAGDFVGMTVAVRTGASAHKLFNDGVQIATGTDASAALTSAAFEILRGSSFGGNEISIAGFGGALSDPEVVILTTLVNTFMDAVAPRLELVSSTTLPDGASNSTPGKGFTCTHFDSFADGTWVMGNHGKAISTDPGQASSFVFLTSAFTAIDHEVLFSSVSAEPPASLQGVAVVKTDDTVWGVSTTSDGLVHVTRAGAFIEKITLADLATLGFPGAANGAAWQESTGWVAIGSAGNNAVVRFVDPANKTVAQRTITLRENPDALKIVGNWLCYTAGENGPAGRIRFYNLANDTEERAPLFTDKRLRAIEGVHPFGAPTTGTFVYASNDPWYHAVPPTLLNQVIGFNVQMGLRRSL